MYPVSNRFKEALKGPHTVIFKFELFDPDGTPIPGFDLEVVGGNVTEDRSRAIRRECTVDIAFDYDFIPTHYSHPLHPLSNNEFQVYRGIEFGPGDEELVPLGIFRGETVRVVEEADTKSIRITAKDRAEEFRRTGFVIPYVVPIGTNYATGIEDFIEDKRPGRFIFSFDSIDAVTPELVFGIRTNDDPLQKAIEMAQSVAHDLYWDGEGVCVLRPAPLAATGTSVATYEGSDLYLGLSHDITSKGVHNHVIVYGEPPEDGTPPIKAETWDDDPLSELYAGDPVGSGDFYSPTSITSEYITSATQAQAVANARYQQVRQQRRTGTVKSAVNPALRASDVITAQRPNAGFSGKFIIERLNIPLAIGGRQTLEVTE